MRYVLTLVFLVLLALPAFAQHTDQLAEELAAQARNERLHAENFAHSRGIPVILTRSDGGRAELVAVRGNRLLYLTTHNTDAATTTRTHVLQSGEFGLTGKGMRIGVWDGGIVDMNHPELSARVVPQNTGATASHATHVGGTIAASGIRAQARGMASEATILSYEWNEDTAEMVREAQNGLLVSNHSYGYITGWEYDDFGAGTGWYWFGNVSASRDEDINFGRYDQSAANYDAITYQYPYYLPVVSAGNDRNDLGPTSGTYFVYENNDWKLYSVAERTPPRKDGGDEGFDSISAFSLAKNVLSVGSIQDRTVPGIQINSSAFSSAGPTDDGRIKPDIMANGEGVFSTTPNGSYGFSSGTSMASPNAAGSVLLLQQLSHKTTGAYLRSASLRGLVIHTAEDAGPSGPDPLYGWGLLNAEAAARHLVSSTGNSLAVLEASLAPGSTFTSPAIVDQAGPVRVTLSWTDPAGTANTSGRLNDSTPVLVNDLDVRLVSRATGEVFQPYVLNPATRTATTGDNRVDNVEQIYVANLPAGIYDIRVTHKGTLAQEREQPFSLLVSGARDRARILELVTSNLEASIKEVALSLDVNFLQGDAGQFVIERAPVSSTGQAQGFQPVETRTLSSATTGAFTLHVSDPLVPAGRYQYRITFIETDGRATVLEVLDADVPAPEAFAVVSSFPNPFSTNTTLELDLPESSDLTVEIYNVLGQLVMRPFEGRLAAARHHLPIDASGWASGVYFVRVTRFDEIVTHKMVLVR